MNDPDHPVLGAVLDTFRADGAGWSGAAPVSWAQGRTLYGGMTAALAWAMTARSLPDLPPLRSAQIAFVGPAAGELVITPTLIRRGRSAAFVRVSVSGEAGPAAECLFSCGAPRESQVRHAAPPAPRRPRRPGVPSHRPAAVPGPSGASCSARSSASAGARPPARSPSWSASRSS